MGGTQRHENRHEGGSTERRARGVKGRLDEHGAEDRGEDTDDRSPERPSDPSADQVVSKGMQEYVEAVALLCMRDGEASVSEIARDHGVRVPTASQAVRRLAEMGLVEHESYGAVRLTPAGWALAEELLGRRRLLMHLFSDVLGLPADLSEQEAGRIEHEINDETLDRVADFVNRHGRRVPLQPRGPDSHGRAHGRLAAIPIDEARVFETIASAEAQEGRRVREVLAKSVALCGLEGHEVALLMGLSDPEFLGELFAAARRVKEAVHGSRLVLFAPLHLSDLCGNECLCCAFRSRGRGFETPTLTQPEIGRETEALVGEGHRRVLLVVGEAYAREGFEYVLDAVQTVRAAKTAEGSVRRVNVNVAPLNVEEFRRLKAAGIGTYQLFQETYHRDTFRKMHSGDEHGFDYRVTALERAIEAGIDDLGVGVLFGLFDWRFEVLALLQHIRHLEASYGVGSHTISLPRLEPTVGSDFASHAPYPVSDIDFRKVVAILRLAAPYCELILSAKETPNLRRETFAAGISQISVGRDAPSLEEVVRDVASMGHTPSFCTSCPRAGRTGRTLVELTDYGRIAHRCVPNALATLLDYLLHHAGDETRSIGEERIAAELGALAPGPRATADELLAAVRAGARDVFC